MNRWLGVLVVAVAGCVTESPNLGGRPNLVEASQINLQLGVSYLSKGQFDMAKEKLERAVEQDSKNVQAHAKLALVHVQLGNLDDARRQFKRALWLDDTDAGLLNNYGTFLCDLGRLEKDEDYLEDGEEYLVKAANTRRYETPELAWANAGECARLRKNYDQAEIYLRESLRLNPNLALALELMARLSFERGNYLNARAFIQRFEKRAYAKPDLLWLAAQTERQLGDTVNAERYEKRLRKEFPDSAETRTLQSRTLDP